ncbi:MAG: alpha/beta hydrolase-fold protein [Bacteroidota bacterium]
MNKNRLFLLALLLGASSLFAQQATPIQIGSVHSIYSEILKEERRYSLSLPSSYEGDPFYQDKAYPVLIVLDGERLFQQTTTVVHALSQGSIERIPEMIVVGVHNTDRNRDMLPTLRGEVNASEAAFLSFLEQELLPHIRNTYRTLDCHVLVGHSYAGLFTVNTFLKNSQFQAFLAIDPSLHWDGAVIVNKLKDTSSAVTPASLYLAQANNPFNPGATRGAKAQAVRAFHQILDSLSIVAGIHHRLDFFEKEDHFSIPLISLYEGLGFLFEDFQFPLDRLLTTSSEDLRAHYDALGEKLGGNVLVPGRLFQQVAFFLLQEGKAEQAAHLFSFNQEHFPQSYQPLEGLGQAYVALNQPGKAKYTFQQVLTLHPESEVANRFLEEYDP